MAGPAVCHSASIDRTEDRLARPVANWITHAPRRGLPWAERASSPSAPRRPAIDAVRRDCHGFPDRAPGAGAASLAPCLRSEEVPIRVRHRRGDAWAPNHSEPLTAHAPEKLDV